MRRALLAFGVAALLVSPARAAAVVTEPIEGYFDRQGVKGFGTLADAAFHEKNRALFPNNGFQNQFTGYHTGVDVEFTGAEDLARDVPVRSVAEGDVIYAGDVVGYGGVIVVRHAQPESVTTLYGHIRLATAVPVGKHVQAGDELALLGSQFTAETSGARKHLHFSVHKGPALELAGHTQAPAGLQHWYDPNVWLRNYLPTASPSVATTSPPQSEEKGWFSQFIDWLKGIFS